jgi:hypothetical protein
VATESPHHPQPDEIPENERTGDEPNPSAKAGNPKENLSPTPQREVPASRSQELRSMSFREWLASTTLP